MPYIIQKRSDIPSGSLQTLELQPNTSIREESYKPISQTGYRVVPPVASAALTNAAGTITFTNQAEGLAAWFLTNVTDGAGAVATGTATVAAVAALDTFTIPTAPAFVLTAVNAARTPGNQDFSDSVAAGSDILSASSLVAAINDVTNWAAAGATKTVTADNAGGTSAVVTITADAEGTAFSYVLASSTGVRLAVAGMTGGLDANSLTTAEADQNVTDILTLLGWNVAGASTALNLAAINGALTTGAILAADVASILDILAGRQYLVPAGVQIETGAAFSVSPAVGALGGPNFDVTRGFRRIYEAGSLRISFSEGRLSQWADNAYVFGGVTGAAVAVYNNDGTLYTGA